MTTGCTKACLKMFGHGTMADLKLKPSVERQI